MEFGSRFFPISSHGFGRFRFLIVFEMLRAARHVGRLAWPKLCGLGRGRLIAFVPALTAIPAIRPTTDDAGQFWDAAI